MQGLEWSENVNSQGKHYLYSETGPHICKPVLKPNAIPLTVDYVIEGGKKILLGFSVEIREEKLAQEVTKECLRCNIDPFKVRIERRGAFLILH